MNVKETYKTPIETTFLWMSALRDAINRLKSDPNRVVIDFLKQQQKRYLHHKKLTLDGTRNALINDSHILRLIGLENLANIAVLKGHREKPCLLDQLPAKNKELHPTRLHDNIYGPVFNSFWMAQLVANPPAEVIAAMTIIAQHYSSYLSTFPEEKQKKVLRKLHKQTINDKRFWFKTLLDMENIAGLIFKWLDYLKEVQKILRSDIKTGEQCISVPYLTIKLFNATNDFLLLKHKFWQLKTNLNYRWNIKPRTGRTIENRACTEVNVLPTLAAGITLRYQHLLRGQ